MGVPSSYWIIEMVDITGNPYNEALDGSNGADVIDGGTGEGEFLPGGSSDDDVIFGGGGNDRLTGNSGGDDISGGLVAMSLLRSCTSAMPG